jgi:hypothetical protein
MKAFVSYDSRGTPPFLYFSCNLCGGAGGTPTVKTDKRSARCPATGGS